MKYAVLAAFVLLFAVLLPLYGRSRGVPHTVFKGLCTGVALALCVIGAASAGTAGGWLLAAGMLLGLLGDLVIEFRLLGGMALFFAGHVLYIAAFCLKKTPGPFALAAFVLLLGATLLVGMRYFRRMAFGSLPYAGYAAVLCAMTALALPLAAQGPAGALAAAGASLFFISDATLAVRMCAQPKKPALLGAFSITCYDLGQFLLALSVLFPSL